MADSSGNGGARAVCPALAGLTRRRFAQGGLGAGLLGLGACGGGGGTDGGEPPVAAGAPRITTQPQTPTLAAGAALSLSVEASGSELRYQWQRDGVAIPGAVASSYTLPAVSVADNGASFAVLVSNGAGSVLSQAARLSVMAAAVAELRLLAGGLGGPGQLPGRGALARITGPRALATRADGSWYLVTGYDAARQVWKVSPSGDAAPLIAFPNFLEPAAQAIYDVIDMRCDSAGRLHVATDTAILRLVESDPPHWLVVAGRAQASAATIVSPDPQAAALDGADHLAFDEADNLYFVTARQRALRKLSPTGVLTTLSTLTQGESPGLNWVFSMAWLRPGELLVIDGTSLRTVSASTGAVLQSSDVATTYLYQAATGRISLVPLPDGGLVFGDALGQVVRLPPGWASADTLTGVPIQFEGGQWNFASPVDGSGVEARFSETAAMALHADGRLLLVDSRNHVVRAVDAGGASLATVHPANVRVSTVLGRWAQPGSIDGSGAAARFDWTAGPPRFLGVDAQGLHLAERYYYGVNSPLHRVSPAGLAVSSTVALAGKQALAVDSAGNIYATADYKIYRLAPGGEWVWLAGSGNVGFADGPAAQASFAEPTAMAVDAQGYLLVGDAPRRGPEFSATFGSFYEFGATLRRISPAGEVTTIAGLPGQASRSNGDVPAWRADRDFPSPVEIDVDAAGNIYVLDNHFATIRRISALDRSVTVLLSDVYATTNREGVQMAAPATAMAVLPSGDICYWDHASRMLRRWRNGESVPLAGTASQDGVRLGPLPASLALSPQQLAASADGKLLYLTGENSVLTIDLA